MQKEIIKCANCGSIDIIIKDIVFRADIISQYSVKTLCSSCTQGELVGPYSFTQITNMVTPVGAPH